MVHAEAAGAALRQCMGLRKSMEILTLQSCRKALTLRVEAGFGEGGSRFDTSATACPRALSAFRHFLTNALSATGLRMIDATSCAGTARHFLQGRDRTRWF